jgi:uncharacterized SAM-binding protein YcdF (DUF218 family)
MRAILLLLILAVVALIVLVATGLIDIRQTRSAKAPDLQASSEGINATGGQTPAFDVETGTVTVGTKPANVQVPVPSVQVAPPNTTNTASNAQ